MGRGKHCEKQQIQSNVFTFKAVSVMLSLCTDRIDSLQRRKCWYWIKQGEQLGQHLWVRKCGKTSCTQIGLSWRQDKVSSTTGWAKGEIPKLQILAGRQEEVTVRIWELSSNVPVVISSKVRNHWSIVQIQQVSEIWGPWVSETVVCKSRKHQQNLQGRKSTSHSLWSQWCC